jgi:hypothetical protein
MPTGLRVLALLAIPWLAGCPGPRADISLQFNAGGPLAPIDPDGDPVFTSEPLFDSMADKVGSHAPTITAFPDGELLVAWYSYSGPGELDGSAIYFARKPSGADRWVICP